MIYAPVAQWIEQEPSKLSSLDDRLLSTCSLACCARAASASGNDRNPDGRRRHLGAKRANVPVSMPVAVSVRGESSMPLACCIATPAFVLARLGSSDRDGRFFITEAGRREYEAERFEWYS